MSTDPTTTIPTLLTVRQFLVKHQWATAGWLRAALFNRDKNGLNEAIVQAGRKILINESRFFQWLDSGSGKAAANE